MKAEELILNIAVNLGRFGRFATDKNYSRIDQFFNDTDWYLEQLSHAKKNSRILPTLNFFEENYKSLKEKRSFSEEWAEEAFTLSNILIHRAKLAS